MAVGNSFFCSQLGGGSVSPLGRHGSCDGCGPPCWRDLAAAHITVADRKQRAQAGAGYHPQCQLLVPCPGRDMPHWNRSTLFHTGWIRCLLSGVRWKILDRSKHICILGPQGAYCLVISSVLLGKLFKPCILVSSSVRWGFDIQLIQLWASEELMPKHLAVAGTWCVLGRSSQQ